MRSRGGAGRTSVRLGERPRYSALLFVLSTVVATAYTSVPNASAEDDLVLRVGVVEEMKTRNLLLPPWTAYDMSTEDVLLRVYDTPVKVDEDGVLRPYLAKGVDFDEDGLFERSEYGTFAERPGAATPLEVVVYYDFNGVRWHDGTQMTVWDLVFAYHLNAMIETLSRFKTTPTSAMSEATRTRDTLRSRAARTNSRHGTSTNPTISTTYQAPIGVASSARRSPCTRSRSLGAF